MAVAMIGAKGRACIWNGEWVLMGSYSAFWPVHSYDLLEHQIDLRHCLSQLPALFTCFLSVSPESKV